MKRSYDILRTELRGAPLPTERQSFDDRNHPAKPSHPRDDKSHNQWRILPAGDSDYGNSCSPVDDILHRSSAYRYIADLHFASDTIHTIRSRGDPPEETAFADGVGSYQ